MATATLDTVEVDGLTTGYRELGDGPAVLLLHGWPTSSYLWRDVMPAIAEVAPPQRLRSSWLNGIKHYQVRYA